MQVRVSLTQDKKDVRRLLMRVRFGLLYVGNLKTLHRGYKAETWGDVVQGKGDTVLP